MKPTLPPVTAKKMLTTIVYLNMSPGLGSTVRWGFASTVLLGRGGCARVGAGLWGLVEVGASNLSKGASGCKGHPTQVFLWAVDPGTVGSHCNHGKHRGSPDPTHKTTMQSPRPFHLKPEAPPIAIHSKLPGHKP